MDTIAGDMPFTLLSTLVNVSGETEQRFLTPFGILDLVFRPTCDRDNQNLHLEITLNGDTENRLLSEKTMFEFKNVILEFVEEIVRKHSHPGPR